MNFGWTWNDYCQITPIQRDIILKEHENAQVTMYETITKAVQLGTVNANRKKGRKPKNLFQKIAQTLVDKRTAKQSASKIDQVKKAIDSGSFPQFGFEPKRKG